MRAHKYQDSSVRYDHGELSWIQVQEQEQPAHHSICCGICTQQLCHRIFMESHVDGLYTDTSAYHAGLRADDGGRQQLQTVHTQSVLRTSV